MECPECGIDLHCGCNRCVQRRQQEHIVLPEWAALYEDVDGELEMCGNCGHTRHADHWLNEEWRQYKDSFQT